MKAVAEVIELIEEEKGDLTIDQLIESFPKSNKGAQEFYRALVMHLQDAVLEERELELKRKRLNDKIKETDPMKALKKLKSEIKAKKKKNDTLTTGLYFMRKMAKAAGIELPTVRQLTKGA